MASKTRQQRAAEQAHRPPRTERARELAEKILELVADEQPAAAGWDWIVWRLWARSPEHARRIAERESIRLTRLGRDIYGHRADLDALAARNAIVAGVHVEDEEIDPEVAAAFGGAA